MPPPLCNHDAKFLDSGAEGTTHCVYCRCLAAEGALVGVERCLKALAGQSLKSPPDEGPPGALHWLRDYVTP